MFGIKTRIIRIIKDHFVFNWFREKISNDLTIRLIMTHFYADEFGHLANTKKADLGYGWIHYGFIRHLKPRRILCIGSRYGFIPALLAQACKDNGYGMVDFVDAGYGEERTDNWTGVGYWRSKQGHSCFKQFGLGNFIRLHVMTTQQFEKSLNNSHTSKKKTSKEIIKPIFDYIYIDGDHSYQGVKLDYELFWPYLKAQGFMTFHDINVTSPRPEGEYGVYQFWKEFGETHSIQFTSNGSGLGTIQKV